MSDKIESSTETYKGHDITLTWFYDLDCEAPWDHDDGHGPVSDWTRRDKLPGERVLCEDHRSKRYYDFAAAVRLAKKDGWDAPPYKTGTKGEQANRAAEADFKLLKRWCDNDWYWIGYKIEIERHGLGRLTLGN